MEVEAWVTKLFSILGVLSIVKTYIPHQLRQILNRLLMRAYDHVSVHCCTNLPEFQDKGGLDGSEMYEDAEIYVKSLESASQARIYTAYRGPRPGDVGRISLDKDQVIQDTFQGVKMRWSKQTRECEMQTYSLEINKIDQNLLKAYLKHVSERAEEIKMQKRQLSLYSNCRSNYSSVYSKGWKRFPFQHPSTFETLALDPSLKERLLKDLDRFKASREFCRQIGRPWKRGYLLHGPPGTGKSSLIAAIANYMRYDIYDLELTRVSSNQQLRALLTQTKEKGIIVIEDIDCSLQLTAHRKAAAIDDDDEDEDEDEDDDYDDYHLYPPSTTVTLSGLLNFTDGLWSCCGEERIIIFTTNHPEHLDPALLRCGRMDVHIELSYCNFAVFKILAFNYLRIESHELYPLVEHKIGRGAETTPAEIIEIFMSNIDNVDEAVSGVIGALDAKIKEKESQISTQSCHTEGGDQPLEK